MQAEVVAVGIVVANEYRFGRIVSPDEEEDLRKRLAAAALGMTLENFNLLEGR